MNEKHTESQEFSYIVNIDNIANKGLRIKIKASSSDLKGLARRFNLLSLENFHINFHVKPVSGGNKISVTGDMTADVIQACIVNLSPVSSKINEELQLNFTTIDGNIANNKTNSNISLNDDDCDMIENNMLDLAEVAAQQLSLIIDPYPRSDNADLKVFADQISSGKKKIFTIDDKPNPFAVLSKLNKKS